MKSLHLRLTFPENHVTDPVIYDIVKKFDVVPSIRRAAIENHFGWMVITLSGDESALAAAQEYLISIGVGVDQAEGDLVAG